MTGSLQPADDWRFRLSFAALFFAITYTALLISTQFSLLQDGDTYWHIATGRWIIENQRVPYGDIFSHTFLNELWLAKEWLSQVILHLAYEIGGWQGLNSFALMLIGITVALLSAVFLSYTRFSIAIGLTIIVAIFGSIHFLARPHLISYPIMLLWTMGVVFAADRGKAPSFWLLPVMTLWANLHGGFTLGLAIAGLMSLETLMGTPRPELKPHIIRHGLFLGLATVAALITPFGIQSILITPKILGLGEVLDTVAEWKSPNFHIYEYHLVVLMAMLGFSLYGGVRLKPFRVIALVLLTYLMFKHLRAMAVFGYLVPILLMNPISTQFPGLSWRQQQTSGESDPILEFFQKHIRWVPVAAAIIMSIGLGYAVTHKEYGTESEGTKPVRELEYARAHGLTGNVFNDYDYGGYLIFSGVPTFIDGRAELYGRDFFNEFYRAAWQLSGGDLFALLDKHDITWTLLRSKSGGAVALDQSPNWQCVYRGLNASIHVRIADPKAAQILEAARGQPCEQPNQE